MKWFIIPSIIFGTIFILSKKNLHFSQKDQSEKLGRILSIQGQVMGKTKDQEDFKNLDLNSPLLQSQKIRTGADSEVLMEFGDQFLLKKESLVFLMKLGIRYQVQLLSGEIQRYSRDKNTLFLTGHQVVHENLIKAPLENSDSSTENEIVREEIPIEPDHEPKIQKLLIKTFRFHEHFMKKCFIKHYERKKGQTQSGYVYLSFYIEQTGTFSDVTLKKSDYKDQKLHLCLQEVASRVQIKNYKGGRIRVKFPIEIKLPSTQLE